VNQIFLLTSIALLTACASNKTSVRSLGPLPEPVKAPGICTLVGVLPDSPAKKAGLKVGDVVKSVNGTQPADAAAMAELIDASGPQAAIEVTDLSGQARWVKVNLNKEKPRLGASCDLTGWRKNSVSAAGNEAITVFQGPYALTISGVIDKKVTFLRVRISNLSDQPIAVSPALFTVTDAAQTPLKVLTPQEVMFFMHGEDGVPMIKVPGSIIDAPLTVPADSVVRQAAQPHRPRKEWSRSDEVYVKSNADYLNKETLWPTTAEPGKVADGLIYFLEPAVLPVSIEAQFGGKTFKTRFGPPQPSTKRTPAEDLITFFESQKKGTAVRLTLKSGKVFVGRYSSYDSLNEIVWFDTPSGVLLTTSSFGLKHIAHAEAMAPEPAKTQTPPAEVPK
jgi:hypothetical protein